MLHIAREKGCARVTKEQIKKFLHCYKDALAATVIFLTFGFFLLYSQTIKVLISSGVTARFMPTVICALGMALSAINIAVGTMKGLKSYHSEAEAAVEPQDPIVVLKTVLSIAFIILYLLLAGRLGFVVATVLYLFGQISLLSESWRKRWWLYLIIAIIVAVSCYLFFRNTFHLMLPRGILPF